MATDTTPLENEAPGVPRELDDAAKSARKESPFDALIPKSRPKVEDIFGDTGIDRSDVPAAQIVGAPPVSRIPARPVAQTSAPQQRVTVLPVQQHQPIVPTIDQYQPQTPEAQAVSGQPLQSMQQMPLSFTDRLASVWPMIVRIVIIALIFAIIAGVVAYALKPEWFTGGSTVKESTNSSTTTPVNNATTEQNQNSGDVNSDAPAVQAPQGTNDSDGDGLTDQEELNLKTDSHNIDTDSDTLSDRQEVQIYHTDPLKKDTDSDSYSDGDEVRHFYNPNGSGTLINVNSAIQEAQQK